MILPFQILLHPFSLNCLRFARYYLRLKRNSTPGETFTNLRAKAEGAEKLITAVISTCQDAKTVSKAASWNRKQCKEE